MSKSEKEIIKKETLVCFQKKPEALFAEEDGENRGKETKRNPRLNSLKEMIRAGKNRKKKVKLHEKKPETVLAEGEGRHFPSGARHSPDLI